MAHHINFNRLKQNITDLSAIGRKEGGGIYRMAFTEADQEARHWLVGKFTAAGIPVRIDGALNVIGTLPVPDNRPTVVVGSHLDTVPNAGALDGALGVLMGLECMQTIYENNIPLAYGLAVVAFTDEEGRFGGMLGSRSFAGKMTPGYLEEAVDLDGFRLMDVMRALGHDPYKVLEASCNPLALRGYLEVHIEQGPVLDQTQCSVGIVTEITGLFKWQVTFTGMSNHAGTTPMHMRTDAFMGLADFAHEIQRIIDENGSEHSRITIGKVNLFPGSANTIPGQAMFSLDVRDTQKEKMQELQDACRKALSAIARKRKLKVDFELLSWIDPVACDPQLIDAFAKTAHQLGIPHQAMPSGAAHDAQMMASVTPIGMMFVPSKRGISHSPHEWTDWQDIETGAGVLLNAIVNLP